MTVPLRTRYGALMHCCVDPERADFANLDFMSEDGATVLHISLRLTDGFFVVNTRNQNGDWGREYHHSLDFPPRAFMLEMRFQNRIADMFVDDAFVMRFAPWPRYKSGRWQPLLGRLNKTRALDFAGALAAETLQIRDFLLEERRYAVPQGFSINDRMEIVSRGKKGAILLIDDAPLKHSRAAFSMPKDVAALPLCGQAWVNGCLRVELRNHQNEVVWQRILDKKHLAATLIRLEQIEALEFDDFAAIQALEHVYHAQIWDALPWAVQQSLSRAADRLGITDYAPKGVPAPIKRQQPLDFIQNIASLLHQGQIIAVAQHLEWLAERRHHWFNSRDIAFAGLWAAQHPEQAILVRAFCVFISAHAEDPWGRALSHDMMDAMLALFKSRYQMSQELCHEVQNTLIKSYAGSLRMRRHLPAHERHLLRSPLALPPDSSLRGMFLGGEVPKDVGNLIAQAWRGRKKPTPKVSQDGPVVVMIISCHAHLEERLALLRQGWLEHLGITYHIVIGRGESQDLPPDVIALDCPDDYAGLPDKILAGFAHLHGLYPQAHIFKIDDDCFVDVAALFKAPSFLHVDYYGRPLRRGHGQFAHDWMADRGGGLDKSPIPSLYADGGTGYALSPRACDALFTALASKEGRFLCAVSLAEDKLIGDLLALMDIHPWGEDYITHVLRKGKDLQVPRWENTCLPFRESGVKVVHLDDPSAFMPRGVPNRPHEIKIWPSHKPIRLGEDSHALTLLTPKSRLDDLRSARVVVASVVRNEMFMLPHFLGHYRKMGITSFMIADNVSDDGSAEYLAAQPDVSLFSVESDYKNAHYGVDWQEAMLAAFRIGKWTLLADADELLFWRRDLSGALSDLLKKPAFHGANAVRVMMLDMYPDADLRGVDFRGGALFDAAPFVDKQPFLERPHLRGPFDNTPSWGSALRHRLCPDAQPQMFTAQKLALLRYRRYMRLSEGLHFGAEMRLARRDLLFGHFKYHSGFHAKAQNEAARGQHFNNAEEYKHYAQMQRSTLYDAGLSQNWRVNAVVGGYLDGV